MAQLRKEIAAIYARMSSEDQRFTSIEDQIKRAKEYAERLGYTVSDELIFYDSAISGKGNSTHKRKGYKDMLLAWDERRFGALFVDELSRLTRDRLEFALLEERIEKSNIRLVSTDGFDSESKGWEIHYAMKSLIASQATKEYAHRVERAMVGQLDRDFMIGAAPFGYKLVRHEAGGKKTGTTWEIVEEDAKWVREMFKQRKAGQSFVAIAAYLNANGVRVPRPPRKEEKGYWRPATVRQLLNNTIYRGVFVLRGSSYTRAKAKKENREVIPVPYIREELRLVDDDTWHACKPVKEPLMQFRGGCKHVFAGLVRCGVCGARLTVNAGESTATLYCAQCDQARRVGVEGRKGLYASANGLREGLLFVLRDIFTPERTEAFKEALRHKLEGGNELLIQEKRNRLGQLTRAMTRLSRLIKELDGDDDILQAEYRQTRGERRECEFELIQLEAGARQADKKAIEAQLAANPLDFLPRLFDTAQFIDQARAVLARLFPRIELAEKPSRFVTIYRISVTPGVMMAELTKTAVVEQEGTVVTIKVTSSPKRPVIWGVELI